MWTVEYYSRKDGQQPVAEWRDSLNKKDKTVIDKKIEKLANTALSFWIPI